jgi:hypothetical protein
MDDLNGEAASTRDTLRYCAELTRPYRRQIALGAGF